MKGLFPAHIRLEPETLVQTCSEHSRNTAEYSGSALKSVNMYSSAYLAGLIHDLGKYKDAYREYLMAAVNGENVRRGSVIHTFAGTRYFLQKHNQKKDGDLTVRDMVSEILAYSVGAHHGLFDCVNEDHENGFLHRYLTIPEGDREAIQNFHNQCADETELNDWFEKAVDELIPILDRCSNVAREESDDELMFLYGLIVRLLTSAVMEGDRRDTAEFMNGAVFPQSADQELWQVLLEKTESKLNTLSSSSAINAARRKISNICRESADKPSGVYRLNVPTGGGKTLSALRYALAHAAKYGKKRIIFTFPLLSILDQNSEVIREYVGDDSVLEHHSNVIQDIHSPETFGKYDLLTENWSSPIIVTTMVQLLNTIFDGKTSSVRRFHALTDAVIVIDEVQTVPGKMLTLFNLAVSFLAEICNTTVLLCSATQPCLEKMTHPIRSMINDVVPYDPALWEVFRRTDIRFAGAYRIEEIPAFAAEILNDIDSLLVVCNKKSESEAIYHAMQDSEYALYHLSASMCMEHRRETLEAIQKSLNNNVRKTVCVATQVIEAGVDISFGAVIRLTAGLDSIIQSAGRCNRHGESDTIAPVYIVRALDENLNHLQEIKLAQLATESLLDSYEKSSVEYRDDLSSDKAVQYYYKRLFKNQYANNMSYHDYPVERNTTIFSLLSENNGWQRGDTAGPMYFFLNQAFASAGKRFQVFDSETIDVIVPWGRGNDIINGLSSERAKYDMRYVKELLDQAKGYTVSLYSYQKKKLDESGSLHPLLGGAVLSIDERDYDNHTGVLINTEKEVHSECDIQIW